MYDILTVVGFKFYEFKPKDSDFTFKGVKLFCVGDDQTDAENNMYGCRTDIFNVSDKLNYDPMLGDRIIISYNRFGKISAVNYAK